MSKVLFGSINITSFDKVSLSLPPCSPPSEPLHFSYILFPFDLSPPLSLSLAFHLLVITRLLFAHTHSHTCTPGSLFPHRSIGFWHVSLACLYRWTIAEKFPQPTTVYPYKPLSGPPPYCLVNSPPSRISSLPPLPLQLKKNHSRD